MTQKMGPIAEELISGRGTDKGPGRAYGAPETADGADAIRSEYENSLEYRIGCAVVDAVTGAYGVSTEQAGAMLGSNTMPRGQEMIALRAAEVLTEMQKRGTLAHEPEEYLNNPAFLQLLGEMPAEIAIRVADAEASKESTENARSAGAQDVIEKLRSRRALPKPIRSGMSAGARTDYFDMSTEEFENFRKRYFGN